MTILFWCSVALVAYVYVGYPVLLTAWAAVVDSRRRAGGGGSRPTSRPTRPGVSIIVAARDEASRLPARIDNLLASAYPRDRLQIVVASDGSSDGTAEALNDYGDRVELILLPTVGKASALNAAVLRARHSILVFADARQRFAPDAIARLVSHFTDPSIGAVSGDLILESPILEPPLSSTVADSVGLYWRYEKWIRRHEAIVGSTLGVTGAIYAMRRDLWQPLPPNTVLDDVLGPMRVVLRGYRVIVDECAHAYDVIARDTATETRRKVRTLAGNFQLLAWEPRLLVPGLNPVWLQFLSHKIGRLLVPYALVAMVASSAVLAAGSLFYGVACAAQVAFYALAAYGARLERRSRSTSMTATEVFREAA